MAKRTRRKWTPEQKHALCKLWQRSSESMVAFCLREEIHPQQLRRWMVELGYVEAEEPTKKATPPASQKSATEKTTIATEASTKAPAQEEAPIISTLPPQSEPLLSVHLPDIVLDFFAWPEPEYLVKVLAEFKAL